MNKETNRDTRAQRSKPAFVAGDQQRESAPQAAKNLYAALSLACAFLELDGGALCPCLQPKKSRYSV
jgi:hypothetical protein